MIGPTHCINFASHGNNTPKLKNNIISAKITHSLHVIFDVFINVFTDANKKPLSGQFIKTDKSY